MADPVGQYVIQPDHLRGAQVTRAWDDEGDPWAALDRLHPLGGGFIVVHLDDVTIAPVPPGQLQFDTPAGDA